MKNSKKRNNKNNNYSKHNDGTNNVKFQIKYATRADIMEQVFTEKFFNLEAIDILTQKFTELRKLATTTISNDMKEFETVLNEIIAIKESLCDKNYFSFDFESYREYLKEVVCPMCALYLFDAKIFNKQYEKFRENLSESGKNAFALDTIKNLLIYHIIVDVINYINSASEKRIKILNNLLCEIQE